MRLLQRYVLSELLKMFGMSLFIITLFMVLVGVFRNAQQQGMGAGQILPLIPYLLPEALRYAIPGTILLAASSVYGRLSASNELVAIKAAGISPGAVLWPTYIFTFLLSLVAVWMNDLASSWGHDGVQRVAVEEVEDIVYGMLQMNKSYSTNRFSISVKGVRGRKLILPALSFNGDDKNPAVTITAKEAEMKADLDEKILRITFRGDCDIKVDGSISSHFPEFERDVPLEEASKTGSSSSPAYTSMREIPAALARHLERVDQIREGLALRSGFQLMCGDFDGLAAGDGGKGENTLRDELSNVHRLQTEPPRRWANGFSCLAFVLVGAPLAIRLRNAELLSSFFLCFGPILVVYYPLLLFATDRAKRGELPPELVWSGNLLLVFWGAWLLKRVYRY